MGERDYDRWIRDDVEKGKGRPRGKGRSNRRIYKKEERNEMSISMIIGERGRETGKTQKHTHTCTHKPTLDRQTEGQAEKREGGSTRETKQEKQTDTHVREGKNTTLLKTNKKVFK